MKICGFIFQILSYIKVVQGLTEISVKCRYRVNLPEASWHTAYDVCEKNNQTLTKINSLAEEEILKDVLEDVHKMNSKIENDYSDVWIGGIMRTSNNESMYLDCKSFKPRHQIIMPETELEDKIACLYFNLTDKRLYVDSCESHKTFVCESKNQAPSNCMMVSQTKSLKDDLVYKLVNDGTFGPNECLPSCVSGCLDRPTCYGVKLTEQGYFAIRYSKNDNSFVGDISHLTHKSFFVFSNYKDSPNASKPKPLSEWCPEMTPEILQKKIDAIQTNLTIDRKNTTKHKRTLISAPDDRISARNLGLVGVVVICLVVFVIVSFDFITFFQISRNKQVF
ncbi:uncharacterized protein LOC134270409 [Saccostrea cucullata]|uniref:uncharacterized protein LOC134270409 n=1 Tax=Saccostrea cuccullata TaxID=36930 RepID=UPI002ED554E6